MNNTLCNCSRAVLLVLLMFSWQPVQILAQDLPQGAVIQRISYRTGKPEAIDRESSIQQQDSIFTNTTQTGGYLPPHQVDGMPPVEFLDWGQSNGGTIEEFQIGYATSTAGPVRIKINFYYGTDDSSDGTGIASFDLADLPGSKSGQVEVFVVDLDISDTPFVLPPGNFGYGYVMYDNLTGPLTATGGRGITDFFRLRGGENRRIPGFFAQFLMNLKGIALLALFVDNTLPEEGDGTFFSPFTKLTTAALVAGIGAAIFVAKGNRAYEGGFTMKSGQSLIGSGVDWTIGGQKIQPAGERPVVTNSAGHGVELAENCTVAGLDIEDAAGSGLLASLLDSIAVIEEVHINGGTHGIEILNSDASFVMDSLFISDIEGPALHIEGGSPNIIYNSGRITQNIPAPAITIRDVSNDSISIKGRITAMQGGEEPAIQVSDTDSLVFSLHDSVALQPLHRALAFERTRFSSFSLMQEVKIHKGSEALCIRDSENSTFTISSLTVNGARNGICIENSFDEVDFGMVNMRNIDSTGVRVRRSGGNVTFRRLDIDSVLTGIELDSLAGRFSITGDGTPGSGGLLKNARTSFLRVRDAAEIEIQHIRVESDFIVDSFFDVFTEISIPASEGSRSANYSLQQAEPSPAHVVLTGNNFTGAGASAVTVSVGGDIAAEIEITDNTITTTGSDGLTVQTTGSSTALVALTGNDISAAAHDFVLAQDSLSHLQLAGFAGGDSSAVAEFIQAHNAGSPTVSVAGSISADPTVSVRNHAPEPPAAFRLGQNYPNPFNPRTVIRFQLPVAGTVELMIYNLAGAHVRTLISETLAAGAYSLSWDGKDAQGRATGSGVYLVRLRAGEFVQQRKMLLVR